MLLSHCEEEYDVHHVHAMVVLAVISRVRTCRSPSQEPRPLCRAERFVNVRQYGRDAAAREAMHRLDADAELPKREVRFRAGVYERALSASNGGERVDDEIAEVLP